ncbi:Galactose mutarotase-like domain-containing protein [Cynara cardunculus var. scolymus]|uniref:Alpha-mannosidase n=1 Tax=Cynara cardunculus var. scolymus TaxID=59895 RepID=A0A103YBM4_CYNCS|nr:Galactose mutarotase-like domain-containing protein [Cynara cardunculus var. scolymus]
MADFRVCLLLSVLFVAGLCVESKYMIYNTSQGVVKGKLNVHLVPHTHDDVGWLKTVDQYYVGSNNSIQGACVQNVLDSLVPALLADKNRKFIYVEQATQATVKRFVRSGQLELINGGWCMHDEAAPHYIDMIDQTTLGHKFIKEQFNVTPRIGWQIDPFGHSAVQAYLLGAEVNYSVLLALLESVGFEDFGFTFVGFDSLFFGRIDYQDRAKRKDEKHLEVIWRGSKSLGSSSQIFAGAFPENYEPPSGFYFEVNDDSPIVQDDITLFDYNVQERVSDFVAAALSQDGRVNALYSTPSIYTDAKHAETDSWPLKEDDYFPYASDVDAYWTGYFTSRAALKGYVRMLSGYYLAARQLEVMKGRNKAGPTTDSLGDALAIAQHHDAVSGTSQQHVANDYAKRLSIGHKEAKAVVADSIACMVSSKSGCASSAANFQECPLLNISYCPSSEADLSSGKKLVVVVYNSLGWKRYDVIRLPVVSENIAVYDSNGKQVESQLLPVLNESIALRNYYTTAYTGKSPSSTPKYSLAFTASVPPLGFSTYVIVSTKRPASNFVKDALYKSTMTGKDLIEVGTGNLKLIYSGSEGKLTHYVNSRSSIESSVKQSYSYYAGFDGTTGEQASGAYIFRPNGTYPIGSQEETPITVLRGTIYEEVHQKINPWIYQITRVYKNKEHAEVEFTVGPIPIEDGVGKEIVTQITTTINSNKTFYSDSNGRDFLQRIRDYRADWDLEVNQPIAGNYYPINLGIYLKDHRSEFSILVDRSVGGSSIVDGQLELMLHRRLLYDDGKGVAEALNETVCVGNDCRGLAIQGKYYLRIDPLGEGAKWRRSYGQEIYSPLLLAFTEQDGQQGPNFEVSTFSGMDSTYTLPDNVALLTLQELEDGKVLLRLAHLYEIGEDKDLSVMTSVELKKLFAKRKITDVSEMSLSANQGRDEMEKKRLVWKAEGSKNDKPTALRGGPVDPQKLVVELAPMEIRTFVLTLVPNALKGKISRTRRLVGSDISLQ